ncbi:flagellar protein FlaG [Pseudoduganella lurida]|uniref:Flagellar protein FlaG n=1 Tax=Pseudoduganella lurida TaxID=1036180 RepID=A0A562R6D4_9BURK|nr:flagellar protein FlaG [Pseudoduganella lurida]TWI64605.1 flagellar protein FlaG [Pseudoduganella lurida]
MTIDTLGSLSTARADRTYPSSEPAAQAVGRAPATAAVTAQAVSGTAGTASMDELKDAVGKLNDSVRNQSLEFSIDEDSKRTIVKVIDLGTKEVVRQIPTEQALQISKSLEKMAGLLIDQEA